MDRAEFEQHAHSWRQRAFSSSSRFGVGFDVAEDIAQDTMLRLWQMRDELERFDSVDALVTTIAKHLTIDYKRRTPTSVDNEIELADSGTDPHALLQMKDDDAWLSARLQQLPSTQRTLLYMRQVERRSHEEIARLMGIETTSVSTLLARARHALLADIIRRESR